MRVLIDAPSLADTAVCFERGNQSAATFYESLVGRLGHCGAMAGDASIAEEFAASYDEAARTCVGALADLVDAFATCGRLTTACLSNHQRAEARSVMSGRCVYDGSVPVRGYVAVLPATPPSALGGDFSGLPDWASWILDQVEGFVWPDADVPRLREAAATWRAASTQVADLAGFCDTAVHGFASSESAELPVAIEVTERLGGHCLSVSEQCRVLAQACDQYADHVEEQRAAILDLVHDLLRDAVVIQSIGIVLGVVTGGVTAAGAAAVNAAKIAAAAPRLLRIISTLRTLASTCAAPIKVAATTLRDTRRELEVFRRARTTVASAYDAERLARVARLRELVHQLKLFDPRDLRGLSREQIRDIVRGWGTRPSSRGQGVVYECPVHHGRQVRVMDGYPPGSRPDPVTWGPYVEVSQGGMKPVKIPLEGNPTL